MTQNRFIITNIKCCIKDNKNNNAFMICDTRMLKNRLLQFAPQLPTDTSFNNHPCGTQNIVVSQNHKKGSERAKIKLIFLSRF